MKAGQADDDTAADSVVRLAPGCGRGGSAGGRGGLGYGGGFGLVAMSLLGP
jgi:hypothetical protein